MTLVTTKRVLIVENQLLFGNALGMILAVDPSIEIVGDASHMSVQLLKQTRPDVVLIDIDEANFDVAAVANIVTSAGGGIRMCALSEQATLAAAQRCREAGLHGVIMKDVSLHEFRRAIGIVASGGIYADPRLENPVMPSGRASRSSRLVDLSMREGEVVRFIVAGLGNREIAMKLSLSEKTVKNHVSRIFSKFDCTARTQVAVQAIRTGLA
jgi:DNA-binding NarL/FixJ family response regulator